MITTFKGHFFFTEGDAYEVGVEYAGNEQDALRLFRGPRVVLPIEVDSSQLSVQTAVKLMPEGMPDDAFKILCQSLVDIMSVRRELDSLSPSFLSTAAVVGYGFDPHLHLLVEYYDDSKTLATADISDPTALWKVVYDVSHALDLLAQRGYIHQDIEKRNILVAHSSDQIQARLVDLDSIIELPNADAPQRAQLTRSVGRLRDLFTNATEEHDTNLVLGQIFTQALATADSELAHERISVFHSISNQTINRIPRQASRESNVRGSSDFDDFVPHDRHTVLNLVGALKLNPLGITEPYVAGVRTPEPGDRRPRLRTTLARIFRST